MRVKLRSDGPTSGTSEQDLGDWITPGRAYEVVELYVEPAGRAHLRVVSDEPATPPLLEAALFEIVDGSLPPTWTAALDPRGALRIGPPELQAEGFWERYFDGDAAAQAAYQRELDRGGDRPAP